MGEGTGAEEGFGVALPRWPHHGSDRGPPGCASCKADGLEHHQHIWQAGGRPSQETTWEAVQNHTTVCFEVFISHLCLNLAILASVETSISLLQRTHIGEQANSVKKSIWSSCKPNFLCLQGQYFKYGRLKSLYIKFFNIFQVPPRPSRATVSRILARQGFVSRRAVKRPLLTMRHRKLRREFAKKVGRWSADQWKKIIFSDEKIFRVRPGGQIRCWKQKTDKKFVAKYVIPTVQKPEGVMIWAAMNGAGRIVLERCPPKVNSSAYQAILQTHKRFIQPRSV